MTDDLQIRAINTIRFLAADAVQQANSGHPGLPMGGAAMAYTLWTRHLRHNPHNPKWAGRDRFILSGGIRLDAALGDVKSLSEYTKDENDSKTHDLLSRLDKKEPDYKN